MNCGTNGHACGCTGAESQMTEQTRTTAQTAAPSGGQTPGTSRVAPATFRPDVDIAETPEAFVITADVPGAKAEGVDVRVERGVLTLRAEVQPRERGGRALLREYGVGSYERTFRVGDGIDAEAISAVLKDGVLTLTLPKARSVRPRSIKVQTA
jgi:HSP20 family molecular chaperone IbpA